MVRLHFHSGSLRKKYIEIKEIKNCTEGKLKALKGILILKKLEKNEMIETILILFCINCKIATNFVLDPFKCNYDYLLKVTYTTK